LKLKRGKDGKEEHKVLVAVRKAGKPIRPGGHANMMGEGSKMAFRPGVCSMKPLLFQGCLRSLG
jgi:hypothetical protein